MGNDEDVLAKLQSLLAAIQAAPDPRRANAEWKQALTQLKKTDAERIRVDNVVAMRSVDKLAELIDSLSETDPLGIDELVGNSLVDDSTCKAALKLFRRRLKFMRLDDESRISNRDPLSSGRSSEILEMEPPQDYPKEVWAELVRRGKLRHTGKGFYELTGH